MYTWVRVYVPEIKRYKVLSRTSRNNKTIFLIALLLLSIWLMEDMERE